MQWNNLKSKLVYLWNFNFYSALFLTTLRSTVSVSVCGPCTGLAIVQNSYNAFTQHRYLRYSTTFENYFYPTSKRDNAHTFPTRTHFLTLQKHLLFGTGSLTVFGALPGPHGGNVQTGQRGSTHPIWLFSSHVQRPMQLSGINDCLSLRPLHILAVELSKVMMINCF